jgi:excisionase family DNA binding protein
MAVINPGRLPERHKEATTHMKPQANRLYLTTVEVAERLRVRPRAVRWLIRTQQLAAQRVAGEFLIEESDLAAFIEAHTISPRPDWGGGGTGWA